MWAIGAHPIIPSDDIEGGIKKLERILVTASEAGLIIN